MAQDTDAPAPVNDRTVEQQQPQDDWATQVYKNLDRLAKDAPRASSNYEIPRQASPVMLSMERSGSLPNCRTSC